MKRIFAWSARRVPVKFFPAQRSAGVNTRVSLPTLQTYGQTFGGEALAWKSLPPYPARGRPQQA